MAENNNNNIRRYIRPAFCINPVLAVPVICRVRLN